MFAIIELKDGVWRIIGFRADKEDAIDIAKFSKLPTKIVVMPVIYDAI